MTVDAALRRAAAELTRCRAGGARTLVLVTGQGFGSHGGRARLPESFHFIAEIIDHFDIVALQEVKNLGAMDRLVSLLGAHWRYFVNDSSGAGRGNHERMAFL
ncbi:MAG: endonuclease/exonuclease/phosphatase, partial [Planctomycetota bacterium]